MVILVATTASAAITDFSPKAHTKRWGAYWVGNKGFSSNEYRVMHFRRSFDLKEQPESFRINVSADNRFCLYVNGEIVARGPARGDFYNWNYDTLDIAKFLKKGKNTIAALVWNAGGYAPFAQFTRRTGFILDGATEAEEFISTPKGWKMKESEAYKPLEVRGLFTGPGDDIDGAKFDWNWTLTNFDDSKWQNCYQRDRAHSGGTLYGEAGYMLTERKIPQMESTLQRLDSVRRFSGIDKVTNFISGENPLTIPANTKCEILLDNRVLTTAYPILKTNGGKGAKIRVNYGEAMFDKKNAKANRNDVDGRRFEYGRTQYDIFRPDGGDAREFSPLWFRTYRYVGLEIETKDDPLVISDLYGMFTGYPFKENGSFDSDDKNIKKIWEVGWRTARLCANETYVDCPYYEQLQYVGDTRIQALISLYVSGDDRLMRQAISAFNASRSYFGLTKSRYPSRLEQHIPPFSLYWISMLNDYAKHRDDKAYIAQNISTVKTVLEWFENQLDPVKGTIMPAMPHWWFVDWSISDPSKPLPKNTHGWIRGIPPESETDGSAIITLHLALTYRDAANLMRYMGDTELAEKYMRRYVDIIKSVKQRCWNAERGIFMDFAGAETSSQHVNIMAILSDAIPESEQPALMKKVLEDKSLIACTFYYRFYLTEAMRKVGMGNLYVSNLKPWYDMINIGLTTFAENPEPTRSDCHAWSSSPNYHLLSLVCGITPADYGFKKVRIEPNLGVLKEVHGKVPHPNGLIEVSVKKNSKNKFDANITLPKGLTGVFVCEGKEYKLNEGKNNLSIR